MSDSWLDHLPSHEREKIRRKLRSAAECERLREKVKGPEDLEREMEKNEVVAELKFGLETEPALQEALRSQVEFDLHDQGMENVFEAVPQSKEANKKIEHGRFRVTVSSHPKTHHDQLMAVPEGNVQEKIPIKLSLSDRYIAQFQQAL